MVKLNIRALTPEWHAKRRESITATDVPAILGLSSYKSALDVWARITGKVEPQELEDNPYLRWGNKSERLNAEMFGEETGRVTVASGDLWQDDARPWLLATPDFFQADEDKVQPYASRLLLAPLGDDQAAYKGMVREDLLKCALREMLGDSEDVGLLECKAPMVFNKDQWEEDIPIAFQVQLVTQMIVTGIKRGSCSALIPPEVIWGDVTPSPAVVDAITTAVEKFWTENVLADKPPTITDRNPDRTLEALRRLHPKDNGLTVELTPEGAQAARELLVVKQELKAFTTQEKQLKAILQREIGDNTFGVIPGTIEGYSWKHQERAAHHVAASEFRVLRKAKIKAGAL